MPNARTANAVRLEFAPDSLVKSNLSGAAFTGDWLWVAGDEACALDRLRLLDPVGREALRFGEVRDFPLADLLDLPGTEERTPEPQKPVSPPKPGLAWDTPAIIDPDIE